MHGAILGQLVLKAPLIDMEALVIEICEKDQRKINFPKAAAEN